MDYDLAEIVVTARRPAAEAIATLREVDHDFIEAHNAVSLDDALELVPGVHVRSGGDGTPRIDVRGLRPRHVKLLINGVPQNGPADGQFDPTLIPADIISRAKLTTGTSSLIYGEGALGGVINLITRRGTTEPYAMFRAEGGSGDATRYGGTIGDGGSNWSGLLFFEDASSDSWPLPDSYSPTAEQQAGERVNSERDRRSLQGIGTWDVSDALSIGVTASVVDGSHGIPGSVIDDTTDIFAQPPKYDRVSPETISNVQVNARYQITPSLENDAWIFVSTLDTRAERFADATLQPTADPEVRGTFRSDVDTRTMGIHDHLTWTHPWGGTVTAMVEMRDERFEQTCVIKDVPVAAPDPDPPPAFDPDAVMLEFTELTTNDHGATTPTGTNDPVARLTARNRAGGGIDFELESLSTSLFGPDSYPQAVLLGVSPSVDVSGWGWVEGADSQGDIGNINFFTQSVDADGYLWPIQVNFRRPEVGDRLEDGETATWSFTGDGRVGDLFAQPVSRTGSTGTDMFAGLRIRGVDGAGFWGTSGSDATGAGPINRLFVQTPAVNVLDNGSGTPADGDPGTGGGALPLRVCVGGGGGGGGGTGDGGGAGDGTGGGNRVTRVPGATFVERTVHDEQSAQVVSTALEFTATPLEDVSVVLAWAHHWQARENGGTESDYSATAGGFWDVAPATRLRASAGRRIRFPSITQLYDPAQGNPDLGIEQAWIIEAGVEHQTSAETRVELVLFQNDVQGFIQLDSTTARFENVAQSIFRGVEVSASSQLLNWLSVSPSYSYLYSRDESPGTDRKQQQYTPEHKVVLDLEAGFPSGWSAVLTGTYLAGQYYYSRGTPRQRAKLDDYGLIDGRLRYSTLKDRITFYVGAENLLDKDYEESYGLPGVGRYLYGGVEVRLF